MSDDNTPAIGAALRIETSREALASRRLDGETYSASDTDTMLERIQAWAFLGHPDEGRWSRWGRDGDTTYVRADLYDALLARAEAAEARADSIEEVVKVQAYDRLVAEVAKAREEGRREGLREAMGVIAPLVNCHLEARYRDGRPKMRFTHTEVSHEIRAILRHLVEALDALSPTPEEPCSDDRAPELRFIYTNWRGETAERAVEPSLVWFGTSAWHPERQWFLRAFDIAKGAYRDFALRDCRFAPTPEDPR